MYINQATKQPSKLSNESIQIIHSCFLSWMLPLTRQCYSLVVTVKRCLCCFDIGPWFGLVWRLFREGTGLSDEYWIVHIPRISILHALWRMGQRKEKWSHGPMRPRDRDELVLGALCCSDPLLPIRVYRTAKEDALRFFLVTTVATARAFWVWCWRGWASSIGKVGEREKDRERKKRRDEKRGEKALAWTACKAWQEGYG